MLISILNIVEDTTVDGPGLRTSIYSAGCPNRCPGCHNPESWDIANGHQISTSEILKKILEDPFANVTFSGGDPMFQADAFTELAKMIKENSNKTIWCYTGYTWEEIIASPEKQAMLSYIDVLVEGRFVEALKDEKLRFRGSSNQRVIDVKASLHKSEPVHFLMTFEK